MPNLITAGGASDPLALSAASDGALTLQTGPSGAKVNALALDATGNGALLGTLTQAGIATPRMQLLTAQNTTSGTSIDFTSIPSWVKRITVMLNVVSTNGTDGYIFQIGAGSVTTSGYVSYSCRLGSASVAGGTTFTTGFGIQITNASSVLSGSMQISLLGSNIWTADGFFVDSGSGNGAPATGSLTLGGTLDRLRLTTTSGTSTFDAGSVNLLLEG